VIAYDVSRPWDPELVQYLNPEPTVDQTPEGLVFIDGDDSPKRRTPLLVVTNEVSGTTSIYAVVR
jgi:hypothetical protein